MGTETSETRKEEDWRKLIGKPIKYDDDTEKLAKSLVPLWQEFAKTGCFGATILSSKTEYTVICRCAGKDQNKHMENWAKRINILDKLCFKVQQHHGHAVTVTPHYNDLYFRCEECKWGFGLDGNGAIHETRAYA